VTSVKPPKTVADQKLAQLMLLVPGIHFVHLQLCSAVSFVNGVLLGGAKPPSLFLLSSPSSRSSKDVTFVVSLAVEKSLELLEISLVLCLPCSWLVLDGPLRIPLELQSFVPEMNPFFSSFSLALGWLE
jgi:hypothetical protein